MLEVQRERENAALCRGDGRSARPHEASSRLTRWHCFIGILAVAAPLVVAFHGRDCVTRWNNLRGRWVAARAQGMIDEGRTEAAIGVLLDAFERAPKEPAVVRTLAIASSLKHPEQAKYLFEQLDHLQAATSEDHTRLAGVLARLNDRTGAAALFAQGAEAGARDLDYWLAKGDFSASVGLAGQARAEYETALTLSPHDPSAAIGLGRLLSSSADSALAADGLDILLRELQQAITQRDIKRRDSAFRAIAPLSIPSVPQRALLAHIIGSMPVKPLELSVLAELMRHPLLPDEPQRLLRADGLRSSIYTRRPHSADTKLATVEVLQAHGEHRIVVEWLPSVGAEMGARLYARRIDSLLALGRTDEAERMVRSPVSPIASSTRNLLLALIELRSSEGKSPGAKAHLAAAMAGATDEGRQSTFMAIGRVALEYGFDSIAVSAFGTAMEFPFGQYLPLDDFVLAARRARVPAQDVLRALQARELIDRWNLDLQKHACYFRLLLATDLEKTGDAIRRLTLLLPDDPCFRLLSALALFRAGDYSRAADILVPLPEHRWHQGEVAVITAIFTAAGNIDQAEKLLGTVHGTGMFAEESALIRAPRTLSSLVVGPRIPSRTLGGLRFLDDKD